MENNRMNVTAVKIDPVVPKPFKHPTDANKFYCNLCQSYSDNFYKSALRTAYKRCRDCHRERVARKKEAQSHLDVLVCKLKDSFRHRGHSAMARGVSKEHVRMILDHQQATDRVKAITPTWDAASQTWQYKLVLQIPRKENK